jgi:hypothetical protein
VRVIALSLIVAFGCSARSVLDARQQLPLASAPLDVPVLTYRPHPEVDSSVDAACQSLDEDLKDHFDFSTDHQRYTGYGIELMAAMTPWLSSQNATPSPWYASRAEYEKFAVQIDELLRRQPSPRLEVWLLERRGSLTDSMWQGITTLEQRGPFEVFSPAHLAVFDQLRQTQPDLHVDETQELARESVVRWRKDSAEWALSETINAYAWEIVVARRHHLPVAALMTRLNELRAQIDASRFRDIIVNGRAPTSVAAIYQRLTVDDLGL